MRILVTGAAGYIGSHTCIELIGSGHEIVALDNFHNSKPECIRRVKEITGVDFPFYEADILDAEALDNIFKTHKIDGVVHFAGLKAVGESAQIPLKYYNNNITGTINLCEVMRDNNVKSIVFSSSATVYGESNPIPYLEDMPTGGCTNPYGRTKYMIELMLNDIYASDKGWKIAILRYFNPIGAHISGRIGEDPKDIPNNLMPYITQVAVNKLPKLSVFGGDYDTKDGTGVRDYIHVCDLARGHVKAIEKMGDSGVYVYNLGTGKGTSVLELIKAFEKASGKAVPYEIVGRRQGDLPEYYASCDKAEKELGFKAEFDILRMCEDCWRWQSSNPGGM